MDARDLLPLIAHILETKCRSTVNSSNYIIIIDIRPDPCRHLLHGVGAHGRAGGGGATPCRKRGSSLGYGRMFFPGLWSQESKRLGFRGFGDPWLGVSCPSSRLLLQQDQWTYTTFSLDKAMSSNLTFPAKEKVGWGEWGEGRGETPWRPSFVSRESTLRRKVK
jgi:hypothetical protein